MDKTELVAAVREHAEAHYTDGGWDVVVECWDDAAIAEQIGRARTVQGAIAKMRPVVSVFNERQADAVISAGEVAYVPSVTTREEEAAAMRKRTRKARAVQASQAAARAAVTVTLPRCALRPEEREEAARLLAG